MNTSEKELKKYFATVSVGLEETLALELKNLGAKKINLGRGGVHFEGDIETCYRVNLWSRIATRVLMPLREFSASTPVMLYDQIKRMKWEQYLDPKKTLAIDCTISGASSNRESRNPKGLTHSQFVSQKIKDAIVDRCREKYGARPSVDKENPTLRLNAYIHGTKCILSIDTTGKSLHERGYRKSKTRAPMKENLAAAIIVLTGWDGKTEFYDPMCGSGTLCIEAALIAQNIAPGIFRKTFGFMGLPEFNEETWNQMKKDAIQGQKKTPSASIFGSDMSSRDLEEAKENARNAGVQNSIRFFKASFQDGKLPAGSTKGFLVMNPPYGERMGEKEDMPELYKKVGDIFKHVYKGWTAFIFTGNLEAMKFVGLRTSKRIPMFNGAIESRLLKYDLY